MTELYEMTEHEIKNTTVEKLIERAHEKSNELWGDFTTPWIDLSVDDKTYICMVTVTIAKRPAGGK